MLLQNFVASRYAKLKYIQNSNINYSSFVLLDINPSDLYDVLFLYANSVTLKIKVRCSRTSLPLDTRSSNIYKHDNINHNVLVFLIISLSDLYEFYVFYDNIVTLNMKVLCSRTSLPLDTRSSNIYKNSNINYKLFVLLDINPSYLYVF